MRPLDNDHDKANHDADVRGSNGSDQARRSLSEILSHNSSRGVDVGGAVVPSKKAIEAAIAQDAALCILSEMQTLGIMSALLSSWGSTLYAGERPADDGQCHGFFVLKVTYVCNFMALAFYFLCIASTLAILGDINGIPRKYLYLHLKRRAVRRIYVVPEVSMLLGTTCLAVGYGVDLGERVGCPFIIFGVCAAFLAIGLNGLLYVLLRRNRLKFREHEIESTLGQSYLATWRDRMDHYLIHSSEFVNARVGTLHAGTTSADSPFVNSRE